MSLWSTDSLQRAYPALQPHQAEALMQALNAQIKSNARQRLEHFAPFVWPRYQMEPFHRLLANTLERVVRREVLRLMIFAPPQHGKSLMTSSIFPAYWLANNPDDPVIISSYAADLATEKSSFARQVVESEEFELLFPDFKTRTDSRAKNRWHLIGHEGGVRSSGVESGITGHPGGLGIIDDPVQDWASAASETIRESTWKWWETTFFPRIWERAPIVIIMTRWDEDDLAARIIKRSTERWEILRCPALAETQEERDENNARMGLPAGLPDPLGRTPGQALAPHRFSRRYLEAIRDGMSSYVWNALYQGSPRPPEGNKIKRAWLSKFVSAVPEGAERVRYWDKAASENTDNCRSAGVLMSKHNGLYYVEDVQFGHWSIGEREAIILQTAILDSQRYARVDPEHPELELYELPGYNTVKIYVEQEPGSGGKESAEATIRNLGGYPIYADRPTGSKDVRLDPFAAQAEVGNIRLVRASWNEAYIDEVSAVPHGRFRDMADATAGAFNKLHIPAMNFGIANAAEDEEEWR